MADRFWVNLYIGHAKRLMGDNTGALEAYRHAASYDIENVEGTESLGEMAYVVATTEPKIDSAERKATLELAVTYNYCRDGVGGLCKLKTVRWRIPVEVSADAKQSTIPLTSP